MFRNLFALFSTLLLGAGVGSGQAAASTSAVSIEQRVQSAQDTLGRLMDAEEQSPTPDSYKVAKDNKSEAPTGANNPPAGGKSVGPPAARPKLWGNWGNGFHNGSWNNWGNHKG